MKPVLVVSLALNLLFVGLIVGGFWHHRAGKWIPKNRVLELSIEQMMTELPAAKRAAGEAALKRLRNEVIPIARGLREARKEAVAAMKADPYDHQRFSDAMARLRDIHARNRAGRHEVALDFVKDLTVAERRRFFEIFRSNLRRGRDKKKDRGKDS